MRKFLKNLLIFAFLALAALTLAHFSYAATLDTGLTHAAGTGLGTEDPRIIAARIIRVILGFLGIVALGLIIYAGFVMMTAEGNATKIEQAKKILIGAVIGLIIVMSSFALASFILSKLLGATEGNTGGGGGGGLICSPPCASGQFCCLGACQATPCSTGNSFYITSTVPKNGDTDIIRNVKIKIFLSNQLDPSSIKPEILKDNLKVEKVATVDSATKAETPVTASSVSGTVTASADMKEIYFSSDAPCNDGKNTPSCFDSWTKFKVTVDGASGLKAIGGQGLSCAGNTCQFEFSTNDKIDSGAPAAGITPTQICQDDGQLKPDANKVGGWGKDDIGLSSLKFFQQKQGGAETGVATFPGTEDTYLYKDWKYDTKGMNVGDKYTFRVESADLADLKGSASFTTQVKPGHCCDGKKDADEEDVDCGGSDCLACVGGPCNLDQPNQCTLNGKGNCSNDLCSSFFCDCKTDACLCDLKPVIYTITPKGGFCSNDKNKVCKADSDCGSGTCDSQTPNGAAGNFITISGKYFGQTPGKVIFLGDPNNPADDKTAIFPDTVNSNCKNYWQDGQIIAVVPAGAIPGPIKVVSSNQKSDATNDDRGPRINDFQPNGLTRPGLCLVNPDSGFFGDNFNLQGNSFSGSPKGVFFGNDTASTTANNIKNWTNNSVDASVPNLAQGQSSVYVNVKGAESNSLEYGVSNNSANNPIIDYIEPGKGPTNQYITIYGKNFELFEAGKSSVVFYLPADSKTLINAGIDFPAPCQDKWWRDSYIIVKVPKAGPDSYKVLVTNKDGRSSNPADFQITSGQPGPGLCALAPHNGPVGQSISAYGDNFLNAKGRAVFYNNVDGLVSAWAGQEVDTSVPSGSVTGPFKVVDGQSNVSNSLPFTVGSCSSSDQCEQGEECCASGTYWAGICQKQGTCNAGAPQICGYAWTFSTTPSKSPILTCSGYNNAQACQAAGYCPNSPGQCQTSTNISLGSCGDDYCNTTYQACSGKCLYDQTLNKCKLANTTCDQTKTVAGQTAECQAVNGKGVWQINTGKASCPSGTFKDTNGWCTLGGLASPETCGLCASGFSCDQGQCVISSAVCPSGSTCTNNQCIKDSGTCECCCRVAHSQEDCCAGLTCQAGGCGAGAPDYGLCTGCKVLINGQPDQQASDNACNCKGGSTPTRFCDLADPKYPTGVCRDKGSAGSSCDANPSTPICEADDSKCLPGLFCDASNNCTCQPGGKIGDSCDTDPTTPICEPNNNMCQPGLACDANSCTCQPGGGAGEACKLASVPACSVGTGACSADLSCLDKNSADCRCCCAPGTKNAGGLSCTPDKSPCDGGSRGLFCGCSADTQCGDTASSGCGFDTCCRARPKVSSTLPADGAQGICRNAAIIANFDQAMDASKLNDKMLVLGDYADGQCPNGTQYLSMKKRYEGSWSERTADKIVDLFARVDILNKILFNGRALALTGNFCQVNGTVTGVNQADGTTSISFAPTKLFDGSRKYYVIVKGDSNLNDNINEGMVSFYGISMQPENNETFNAVGYQGKVWSFTTMSAQSPNNGVCVIDHVDVSPSSYLFKTTKGDPLENDNNPADPSFDTKADNDKVYAARALSKDGQALVSVPEYSWSWNWASSKPSAADFVQVAGLADDKRLVRAQDGVTDDMSLISATADLNNGQSVVGVGRAYVFVCEDPWPSVGSNGLWSPWRDDTQGMKCLPGSGNCYNTNYELYYCRDAGGPGTADDLPAILSNDTIIRGSSTVQDLIKESYFLRENTPDSTALIAEDQKTGDKIYAAWAPVTNAKGYKIYYGTASGVYSNVIDNGNNTSRILTGLTDGTAYYITVTAYFDTGAESTRSNEVKVTPTDQTPPAAPSGLQATAGSGSVTLSWNANTDDTAGYKIYYGASSGSYGAALDAKTATSAIINGLTPSKTYYFTVTAVDPSGNESARAGEVTAIPN